MANIAGWECSACGRPLDRVLGRVCECDAPPHLNYQFQLRHIQVKSPETGVYNGGLWRYGTVLPSGDYLRRSLGEGNTPLIEVEPSGSGSNPRRQYLKLEGRNPTGSFEDRGMACAISVSVGDGMSRFALQSSELSAVAASAYASLTGSELKLFPNAQTSEFAIRTCRALGASVTWPAVRDLTDEVLFGLHAEKGRISLDGLRIEGLKTMAYEIAEQLGWRFPGVVICFRAFPLLVAALRKGFEELRKLGWVSSGNEPRLVAVSVRGRGLQRNHPRPNSYASLVDHCLSETGGAAIDVTYEEVRSTLLRVARQQGVVLSSLGAGALAAMRQVKGDEGTRSSDAMVAIDPLNGTRSEELLKSEFPRMDSREEGKLGGLITPR